MIVYERVEPVGRCVSPDGHEWTEVRRMCDVLPESCYCPRCGKPWQIVSWDEPEGRA